MAYPVSAMAALAAFILCFSFVEVRSGDVDVSAGVAKAREHVQHMLALEPLPNAANVGSAIANESHHLAHEIRKLHAALNEKVPSESAVLTELEHIAAGLDQTDSMTKTPADLREGNSKYFGAVDKVLEQLKKVHATEAKELIDGALNGLAHDVDNYQHAVHKEVGSHEGQERFVGGDHAAHVAHAHNAGSSSEEHSSSEEKQSHSDHHHHH